MHIFYFICPNEYIILRSRENHAAQIIWTQQPLWLSDWRKKYAVIKIRKSPFRVENFLIFYFIRNNPEWTICTIVHRYKRTYTTTDIHTKHIICIFILAKNIIYIKNIAARFLFKTNWQRKWIKMVNLLLIFLLFFLLCGK